MRSKFLCTLVLILLLVLPGAVTIRAQQPTATATPVAFKPAISGVQASDSTAEPTIKGFTLVQRFEGSTSEGTTIVDMNTALGYNFSEHFGIGVGVPVFFLAPDGQPGIASNTTGLGNISIGVHSDFDLGPISYSSSITAAFPTANTTKGLSSGRVIVDWDNRFEHSWGIFTPYVDVSLGNGINNVAMASAIQGRVQRPYITLGKEMQFEGGIDVKLAKKVTLGASGYNVVPWGKQKVYSWVVRRGTVGTGKNRRERVYETMAVSEGSSDLDRDNGFNTAVGFQATRTIGLNFGFSRSVRFESNSVSFGAGFNLSRLFHPNQR